MLLALLACSDPSAEDAPSAESTDPTGEPAALATPSGGDCPTIESGKVEITSAGLDRSFKVLLPEGGGEGKGVVFAWYPLGASSSYFINALGLEDWAVENDMVVVVPNSSGEEMFEWAFLSSAEGNIDLVFYDDMRTCLSEGLGVDLSRVTAMGFSAGALFTSFLSLHRGDTLATILPFSGGTDPVIPYRTPASAFPAFLTYGGQSDIYGGGLVNFWETQGNFADDLVEDGHFVVLCNHEGGHTIPPEGIDMMTAWLPAHTYGVPSPFIGDISTFPDYCDVHAR